MADNDATEYARLASESYNVGSQQDVGDWQFDDELSNTSTSVFFNPSKNEVAFAHRGTNPKKWRDHAANALLALGLTRWSNRFKRSERAVEAGMAKYADSAYIHAGHSAGGTTAIMLGTKYKHAGHAFNPGMSPIDKHPEIHDAITVHHVVGDPVSQMLHAPESYLRKNVRLYAPSARNPHSLKNFLRNRQRPTQPTPRMQYV